MKNTIIYRLSLGLSIFMTLAAFVSLLGWLGIFINGAGHLPALMLLPWIPMGLIALTAINCILRARLIVRRGQIVA